MMSLISLYEKFETFIMKIFYAIVVIASVIIPVGLFLQVLCRYFLKNPIPGVEELATAAFTIMVVFGSAILFRDKKHIVVDVFVRMFSDVIFKKHADKVRAAMEIIANICMIFIFAMLIYSFYQAIPIQKSTKSLVLKIPNSAYSKAMIVSFVLMLIDCIKTIIKRIRGIE